MTPLHSISNWNAYVASINISARELSTMRMRRTCRTILNGLPWQCNPRKNGIYRINIMNSIYKKKTSDLFLLMNHNSSPVMKLETQMKKQIKPGMFSNHLLTLKSPGKVDDDAKLTPCTKSQPYFEEDGTPKHKSKSYITHLTKIKSSTCTAIQEGDTTQKPNFSSKRRSTHSDG